MKKLFTLMISLLFTQAFSQIEQRLSFQGVDQEDIKKAKTMKLAPKGSASITASGNLSPSGIKAILHAATGSMTKSGKDYDPDLKSIELSIKNSILLAKTNQHSSIAVPFIGSGIFLSRIGVTKEELASAIIKTMNEEAKGIKVVFVAYGDEDFKLAKAANSKIKDSKVSVVKGSITDYNAHKSSAIVNAANTELVFGGGLSGVIGKATGKSRDIDSENRMILKQFAP